MTAARRRAWAACAVAALVVHGLAFDALRPATVPRQAPAPQAVQVRTIEVALPANAPLPPVPAPIEAAPPRPAKVARAAKPEAPAPPPEAPPAVPVAVAAVEAAPVVDDGEAAPTYATRSPPAATLHFRMRRGVLSGNATLAWAPRPDGYEARLEARIAGALVMEQISRGGFDAAGLAPERFTDRRARRGIAAANFQRERGLLTFSGSAAESPLRPGMQDRLSWLLQIAAIAGADPAALRPGAVFAIRVAGARGDVSTWQLEVAGEQVVAGTDPPRRAWRLVRAARGAYDGGAEVWLDPQHAHLPIRLVLHAGTDGDGRNAFELVLQSIEMPP